MSNSNDTERNKALVRRCVEEIWNGGRTELIPELVQPYFRWHQERNVDRDVYGQEGFSTWVSKVRSGLPDLHLAVELMFAQADRVVLHLRGTGTHRGEFCGLPASGTALHFTVTAVVRVAEGKMAECWAIPDELGVRQQLGVVQPLG
jgi:steroid delta-isomerase-like uncharacterized protein